MRKSYSLLSAFVLLTCAGSVGAQEDFLEKPATESTDEEQISYALLRPSDKSGDIVQLDDRNPFGRADDGKAAAPAKGSNEENAVRDHLMQLRVVGVSPGTNGLRVMLGDMVLEQGQYVPQVLADQSVKLIVQSVSEYAIELRWEEKKENALPARVLTIPVDLRPTVRYALQGQPSGKNQWDKQQGSDIKNPTGRLFLNNSEVGRYRDSVAQDSAPEEKPTDKLVSKPEHPSTEEATPSTEQTSSPAAETASPTGVADAAAQQPQGTWNGMMGILKKMSEQEGGQK